MPDVGYTPMVNSQSRVYIIEGRARGDHNPMFNGCLRATALSQGYGDIEPIQCPDPSAYGKYIEVGQVKGATERATLSLEGRFALDVTSTLLRLAKKGCPNDVQLHLGDCTDPRLYNAFKKVIMLEDVYPTNYATEDLGSLQSGDNAPVNETSELSTANFYEVVPVSYSERAMSLITNEILDITICDALSCGACASESDGCNKIYAITKAAGGSVGTMADLIASLDGGASWFSRDIDTLGIAIDPDELACVSEYVVVVSRADNAYHYTLKSEITPSAITFAWTRVNTGIIAGGGPSCISSYGNGAFVGGGNGYLYKMTDVTAGLTVLDAGAAAVTIYRAIHALSDSFAIAVGDAGTVCVTLNGDTWQRVSSPVGFAINVVACWAKSRTEWWIGCSDGYLYYTLNGGVSWTRKAFSGAGAGTVHDIFFPTDSVGYMSHSTAAARARIFRTIDGGYSWSLEPQGSAMPLADSFGHVESCESDPNFVVAGGLADNATDGVIVVGEGA